MFAESGISSSAHEKMDIQMYFNSTQHFEIFFPSSLMLNPKNKSSIDHKPLCIHPPAETVLLDLWSGSSWSSVEPSWVGKRQQHGGREAVSQGGTPNLVTMLLTRGEGSAPFVTTQRPEFQGRTSMPGLQILCTGLNENVAHYICAH